MIDRFLSESPWVLTGICVLAGLGVVGLFVNLHFQLDARRRRFRERFHQRPPSLSDQLVRARFDRLQEAGPPARLAEIHASAGLG